MSKEEATFEDVALATRHGKEAAIADHLRQVGLLVTVPPDFPSDDFGTFSGERERPGSQFETAVAKARKAIELTGLQKAVASEGAYGPHPVIPFVPLGRELVVLLDAATETVVEGWWSGTKTNFRSGWVSSLGEAEEFAQRLGFPEHGLIVRSGPEEFEFLEKGIVTHQVFQESVEFLLGRQQRAFIEADMRAMVNPTRMSAIEQATRDLVTSLKSFCPACQSPGFRVREVVRGLPCSLCDYPTEGIKEEVFVCRVCQHRECRKMANRESADPCYCPVCNP